MKKHKTDASLDDGRWTVDGKIKAQANSSRLLSGLGAGDWTLFLDRDGVINQRLKARYVADIEEFKFIDGALEAIRFFTNTFNKIIIVTNQQGIDKGIMTHAQLERVHAYMKAEIEAVGGRIDAIYYCPKLAKDKPECRKPNTGMALQAQADFPEINFEKSIMVGDSASDMEFGLRLGMTTIFIQTKSEDAAAARDLPIDFRCDRLIDIVEWMEKKACLEM